MLAGGTRIVVVMVGLPARGKTYISYKVSRYLAWLGVNCRVFNVGEYRRKMIGAQLGHDFFDPENPVAIEQRLKCAVLALNDMFKWFEAVHNGVAIYDATNSTRSRRKMISDECRKHNVDVMFCESWCDDEKLVDMNILEVKRTSPDYKGVSDYSKVLNDFRHRIDHYSEVYEPVGSDGTRPLAKKAYPFPPVEPTIEEYDEEFASYARKINVGSKVVINRINSYLKSRIVYFLMNIHIATRSVLFSRHGESIYNLTQRLGGDPDLSPNGRKYSEALPGLISKLLGDQPLTVWTSTMRRTNQTASGLPHKKLQWKALDELDAGLCDGLTYEEVEQRYPEEYAMRDENKFEFRYRGGESYRDVVLRLEPVIMELERQQNIMVISHQAVLRCIYAYFLDIGPDELPYLKIPLHTVMKLTWTAYGCDIQTYKIDIDAVDTHRAKPKPAKKAPAAATAAISGTAAAAASAALNGGGGMVNNTRSLHAHLGGLAHGLEALREEDETADKGSRTNAVSDTWDVDELWNTEAEAGSNADRLAAEAEAVLPTPPTTTAPALALSGAEIRGEQSALSTSGGHDHGGDGHAGNVWPSQISPAITRDNSRAGSPEPIDIKRPRGGRGRSGSAGVMRSDPREGSPVCHSPSKFAATFKAHYETMAQQGSGEGLGAGGSAHVVGGADSGGSHHLSVPSTKPRSAGASKHTLLGNLKFDELHIAGHGNVDVVETTPTITLRYSSNVPPDVQKQTMALKNELVGIEDESAESSRTSTVS